MEVFHSPATGWDFLAVPANKTDLACFISNYLIANAPANKSIVVSGGFVKEDEVKTTDPNLNINCLKATHEDADTRLILHCIHANVENVVVSSRDTDVLVLLVGHYDKMSGKKIWMKAGTSRSPKYIPVHEIRQALSLTPTAIDSLLAFHAITGCDTVSFLVGHSKKSAWKVFISDGHLLKDLGRGELTEEVVRDAEKFVCKVYNVSEVNSCNEARVVLFCKCKTQDELPPTTDALHFHIQRAHYQSMIWRQASEPNPPLPSPTTMGWRMENGQLVPILTSLAPIPDACQEIVSCGCTKGCISQRCTCKKSKLMCSGACRCSNSEGICMNRLS